MAAHPMIRPTCTNTHAAPRDTTIPMPLSIVASSALIEARQGVLEEVVLCYGVSAPTGDVPRTWIAPMRDTYAARQVGSSWSDALKAAGLELQLNEADLTSHYEAIRAEMYDLYDRIPAMVDWIECYTGAYTHRDLVLKLRQLLM